MVHITANMEAQGVNDERGHLLAASGEMECTCKGEAFRVKSSLMSLWTCGQCLVKSVWVHMVSVWRHACRIMQYWQQKKTAAQWVCKERVNCTRTGIGAKLNKKLPREPVYVGNTCFVCVTIFFETRFPRVLTRVSPWFSAHLKHVHYMCILKRFVLVYETFFTLVLHRL